MEKTTIGKIITRILYTASILYYSLHLYNQSRTIEIPYNLHDIIVYFSLGLSLVAILTTRLYWTPILSLFILSVFQPLTSLIPYLFPIIILAYIYKHISKIIIKSKIRVLTGIAIFAFTYTVFALIGYGIGYSLYKVLQYKPPLTGDAAVVVSVFSSSLAFKIFISAIFLTFIYKAASSLLEFTIALTSRGETRRALFNEILEKERTSIVEFKGSQYGALEWGMSLFLTLLIAPVVYRPVAEAMDIFMASLGVKPGWTGLIAAFITTIIAWIPIRMIVTMLVRTMPLKAIIKPSYTGVVLGTLLTLSMFIVISLVTGYNILYMIQEAITGNPTTSTDPLSSLISNPSEEYYRNLAKILDLIVRLFWGG